MTCLNPHELDVIAEVNRKLYQKDLDLQSCQAAFDEANSHKPSMSFWDSDGGNILKAGLLILTGGLIVKAWDQNH